MKIKKYRLSKIKSKFYFLIIFILIFSLSLLCGAIYLSSYGNRTLNLKEDTVVKIDTGSSLKSIANQFEDSGLLSNDRLFKLYYMLHHGEHFIAGNYLLNKDITISEFMQKISDGDVYRRVFEFNSGFNLVEVANYWQLKEFGTSADFLNSSKSVASTIELDGFDEQDSLACFLTAKNFDLDITMSSVNLLKKVYEDWLFDYYPKLTYAKANNQLLKDLSLKDLAVLSSIVTQESANPDEQIKIASIYVNRLAQGQALQADPTINYLVKSGEIDDFDTNVDSKFNTYRYAGLPPDCIAINSQSAINSLLKVTQTNDLYFIAGSDGKLYTAETYQEHLNNIENNGLSVGN